MSGYRNLLKSDRVAATRVKGEREMREVLTASPTIGRITQWRTVYLSLDNIL